MRRLKIAKSITNREDSSLSRYLFEISKIKLIGVEEEIELAQRIKIGDESAFESLVNANLRFVVSVAKQYQNQGLSLPDLINEGNLGLIRAAQRFDETKGFKFISYAVWWIRQSIILALGEQSRIVRIPFNQIDNCNQVNKAYSRLEQLLQRPPTPEEISKTIELSIDKINDSIINSQRSRSLDVPIFEEGDETLLDFMSSQDSVDSDNISMKDSLSRDIESALTTISEREADIIKMFYGIGGPEMSIEEIGLHFSLTGERVRQLKNIAIRRLKCPHRCRVLKTYLG